MIRVAFLSLLLAGCSYFSVDNFDSIEYHTLVSLYVLNESESGCEQENLSDMMYTSRVLVKYSEGTLNSNINDIYVTINDLVTELNQAENPSNVYCGLKRRNISDATQEAITSFGKRKKG